MTKFNNISDVIRYLDSQFQSIEISQYTIGYDQLLENAAYKFSNFLHDQGFKYGEDFEDFDNEEENYDLIMEWEKKNWCDIVNEFEDGNHFDLDKAIWDEIQHGEQLFRFAKGAIPLKDCEEISGFIRDEDVFLKEMGRMSSFWEERLSNFINELEGKHKNQEG